MIHSNYSTPVKHIILTPKQQLICNYNSLMNHYQELESSINTQKVDDQTRYLHLLSKIDSLFNDVVNNIAELQKSTFKDYSSFLQELKTQRDNYLLKAEFVLQKPKINYQNHIEKKAQYQQNMFYSQQKNIDDPQLMPITSAFKTNSTFTPSIPHQSQTLPINNIDQKDKIIKNSTLQQLQNQDQNQVHFKQQNNSLPLYQSLSHFRFKTSPPKQIFSHHILKKKEVNDVEPLPFFSKQNHNQQPTIQSLELQLTEPFYKQQHYNHATSPDQLSLYDDYEQFISKDCSQSTQNFIHLSNQKYQKKKIFEEDQNEDFQNQSKNSFNTKSNTLCQIQNAPYVNTVPVNNTIMPVEQGKNKAELEQNYINDLFGNLGYDQFYQYLCQRYPLSRVLKKFYKSKQNCQEQRSFKQEQDQIQDFMSYIYCTQCDQFISINQANNHANFCMNNKTIQQNNEKGYLDYLICCNGQLNKKQETKEQKDKYIVNDLAKIRYLMEVELKIKDPLNQIHEKQKEYCLFALEILNQIIENPQNLSFNQQVLDLISIYQVLDQQQCNFYQQFIFLLQKANVKLQKLI